MNPGIEAARFVLAAAVVLFHWNGALPSAFLAVDLFFIISGLVIGRRYEAAQRAGGSMLRFALGRAIRLYPLYVLGLASGLASHLVEPMITGDWSYSTPGLVWRGLLLLPVLTRDALPVGIQSFPLDVPAWSLWCEVLANLLFCVLCRGPRWLMAVPMLLGLAVLVGCTFPEARIDGGGDGRTVVTGLGRIGFSFFAGVLLARCPPLGVLHGWRAVSALVAMLTALLACFGALRGDDGVAVLILLVAGFPALTICIAACEPVGWVARLSLVAGGLSYALYILHWPLERLFRSLAVGIDRAVLHGAVGSIVALLLLVGVAHLATEWFDRPVRRRLRNPAFTG